MLGIDVDGRPSLTYVRFGFTTTTTGGWFVHILLRISHTLVASESARLCVISEHPHPGKRGHDSSRLHAFNWHVAIPSPKDRYKEFILVTVQLPGHIRDIALVSCSTNGLESKRSGTGLIPLARPLEQAPSP